MSGEKTISPTSSPFSEIGKAALTSGTPIKETNDAALQSGIPGVASPELAVRLKRMASKVPNVLRKPPGFAPDPSMRRGPGRVLGDTPSAERGDGSFSSTNCSDVKKL